MNKRRKITIRRILIFLFVLLLLFIARPISFLIYTFIQDAAPVNSEKPGYANDASSLNETQIIKAVNPGGEWNEATLQISNLIKQARLEGKKISIAGAQHSMGGHTIYPDGIVLNMRGFNYMKFDSLENILLVGSGALWSDIIPFLDKIGKSVGVMQSNNSFSVGGSISVNCHGWQLNSPPISSTVQSFRLINSGGEMLNCSREENKELFSLAMGGYGLFGVIIDVKLRVVENDMYRIKQRIIKSEDYIKEFDQHTKGNANIGMAFGRINISPENFMEESILSTFTIDNKENVKPLQENDFSSLRRTVFRSSANSAYGKNLRWKAEKLASSGVNGKLFSRNQLLNEGVDVFQNTDTNYTDILHEYFIPKISVNKFIKEVKKIMPGYNVDLLNITIRDVGKDDDTFLNYANEEVFGFVLLFNQSKNKEAEIEMKRLTQRLIDIVIALKGTYYLPYRLHATKEQMHQVYPQAREFFLLKKKYDSTEVFQNYFYKTYK